MEVFEEFMGFLQEYDIIGLAIALVIGLAVKDLVNATVDDFIMPIIGVFLPSESWETAVFSVANIDFAIGHWFSVALEFLIIAFLIFMFVKRVMKKEKVEKI